MPDDSPGRRISLLYRGRRRFLPMPEGRGFRAVRDVNVVRCIVCGEKAGMLERKPSCPVFCSEHCARVSRERGMGIKVSLLLDQPKPYIDRRRKLPQADGTFKEAPEGGFFFWEQEEVAPGCYLGDWAAHHPRESA